MRNLLQHRVKLIAEEGRRWRRVLRSRLCRTGSPEEIQVIVTDRCNYRCPTCIKWQEVVEDGELSPENWKGILDRVAFQFSCRRMVFGGGEPLLRPDLADLIRHAVRLGFVTVLATNGSLLDRERFLELQDAGLHYLMLSLNGTGPEIHDRSRGLSGSFQAVRQALEICLSLRKSTRIGIGAILQEETLPDVFSLVDLAERRRLHGVLFQAFMEPTMDKPFRRREVEAAWPAEDRLSFGDPAFFGRVMQGLLKRQWDGAPILNPRSQLKAMIHPARRDSIRSVCSAGVRNFLIDPYGGVRSCFRRPPIGNIMEKGPATLWRSDTASGMRREIRMCRRPCRLINRNY